MDLSVVFLGTGGSVPTARRATACVLARRGRRPAAVRLRRGRRSARCSAPPASCRWTRSTSPTSTPTTTSASPACSRPTTSRAASARCGSIGPPGLRDLFKALARIVGRLSYERRAGRAGRGGGDPPRGLRGALLRRRPPGAAPTATRWSRTSGPGRFDPSARRALGVAAGPDFGRLQAGEPVHRDGRRGQPGAGDGRAERRGRKVVITGDTAPCEMTRLAAHEAELLVHDGSFADDEAGARGRDRALDRAPGGRAGPRRRASSCSRSSTSRSRYDVRERAGRGAGGVRRRGGPARLRPRRDPLPGARRARG